MRRESVSRSSPRRSMAAAIESLRAVMSTLPGVPNRACSTGGQLYHRAFDARGIRAVLHAEAVRLALERSSVLLELVDRDGPHRLQPDATSRDVPNLAGHRERAELVAQDVDPADLAERQRRRRRERHPEPVTARILGAPEQRLVVDPQTNGPRDGESRVTTTFGRRAHDPDRLTRTHPARRPSAQRTRDEAQCPSRPYTFRATGEALAPRGVPPRLSS